jgi:CheY-like chemotaxis protein
VPHTLLLADDSVTIQRVIELTFADEDIRVVAVSDGRQAVLQAQQEAPDIVLADIGMPEMDGYEVAAFIKRTPWLSHIPVLLLTGAFEPVDDARAREVGCDGVLVKPFEPQMVISRVKDLIAGRPVAAARSQGGTGTTEAPFTAPPPATDEYFERLDAALSSFDSSATLAPAAAPPTPAAQPAAAVDTPTLAMPAPVMAAPAPAPQVETAVAPPIPEILPGTAALPAAAPASVTEPASPRSSVQTSPLAEAFEALLAAEQGTPLESAAAQRVASSDTLVDHITRQVIERLADERMREVVLEVAERLVREEIDRIKSAAS